MRSVCGEVLDHKGVLERAADDVREPRFHGRYTVCKAVLDRVVAALMLVMTAPLMALMMLIVKLESCGPAIYSQTRLGQGGRWFKIYKIRTMVQDSEAKSGPQWSCAGDPRVTTIGRVLRATHLDEFPQLYNILRGEMSLIGPRPERPEIADRLILDIPRHCDRLAVRPGVTGLAQVQLPPDTDVQSVQRKLVCDLYYIRELSLSLDLKILACTMLGLVGIPYSLSRKVLGVPSPLKATAFVHENMNQGGDQLRSGLPRVSGSVDEQCMASSFQARGSVTT
jgi:lipopolysaccharide/colanic/teichoic acid biosynthesis glycosyltransferase